MSFRTRLSAFLLLRVLTASAAAEPSVRSPQGAEVVAIGAYIRSHMAGIDECYGQRLNLNAHLRGKLVLRFDIDGDGAVSDPSADGMTDKPLVDCVLGQVRTWRFERPAAALRVAYPVTFQPG